MQSQHADCSRLKLSVMYFISSSFFFFFLLEMWQHLLCHENDSKLRVVDWIAFGIVGICSCDLHSSLYSCLFGTAPLTPRDTKRWNAHSSFYERHHVCDAPALCRIFKQTLQFYHCKMHVQYCKMRASAARWSAHTRPKQPPLSSTLF